MDLFAASKEINNACENGRKFAILLEIVTLSSDLFAASQFTICTDENLRRGILRNIINKPALWLSPTKSIGTNSANCTLSSVFAWFDMFAASQFAVCTDENMRRGILRNIINKPALWLSPTKSIGTRTAQTAQCSQF